MKYRILLVTSAVAALTVGSCWAVAQESDQGNPVLPNEQGVHKNTQGMQKKYNQQSRSSTMNSNQAQAGSSEQNAQGTAQNAQGDNEYLQKNRKGKSTRGAQNGEPQQPMQNGQRQGTASSTNKGEGMTTGQNAQQPMQNGQVMQKQQGTASTTGHSTTTGTQNAQSQKMQNGTSTARRQGNENEATGTIPQGNQSTSTQSTNTQIRVQGRFNLDEQHAAQFHQRLLSVARNQETNINIAVNVGVTLPADVRPVPLPTEIVAEFPQFRGYDYIVVRDEIVIIEPGTRKVVEIIGSSRQAAVGSTRHLKLSQQQREMIRRDVRGSKTSRAEMEFKEGAPVPESVTMEPLPDTVVREVPDVRSYDYVVGRDDRIVIVDPGTREVLDVID